MAFVVEHSEVAQGCDPLLGSVLGAGSMQKVRKFPDEATRDAVLAQEAEQRELSITDRDVVLAAVDEDIIRCILEHACHIRARRNVHPLEARSAMGEWSAVSKLDEDVYMKGNGIIRSGKTILFDVITCSKNESGVGPIWASEMVKTIDERTKPGDLCIIDPVGDECDEYEDERCFNGVSRDDEPRLFSCLGWGSRKRVSYSIRLSRAISVSVAFDVIEVPTSWLISDCDVTFWVIQILDARNPLPNRIEFNRGLEGYTLVGWGV